jgi:hypothetical protein
LRASKDGRKRSWLYPSRLAVKNGEHLRMTACSRQEVHKQSLLDAQCLHTTQAFAHLTKIESAVIASQRVGAKRRPMTGSAKQSRDTSTDWIASSLRSSQ